MKVVAEGFYERSLQQLFITGLRIFSSWAMWLKFINDNAIIVE